MAWNIDVKTTTIANCFRHCKIRSEENDEQELGEINEGVEGLNEVISNLRYRNVMDVEHLLNYPNENDAVMESPTDEEIIESVMSTDEGTDPEPDDSNVIPSVSSKEAFQTLTTLNNYLLQHEQNIPGAFEILSDLSNDAETSRPIQSSSRFDSSRTHIDSRVLQSSETVEKNEKRKTVTVIIPQLEELGIRRPG
ncbi:uncharacterized protein LOC141665927 [Apium graveolens]|uniref:uncharacterized protein LOC141665927 n=1 Tax=Apium graveolens TaxID=4045 RepID=UPI003D7AC671